MARKIVITSGKGGVGKTTVAANLGAKIAATGKRVVLVDLDIGLNNLDIVMGIENKVVYDIIDCVKGRCRIKQALIAPDKNYPSLYVLPSCHGYDKASVTGQNIKIVIDKLAVVFDYILIDCPAGIENGFHRAASVADEAIIVTTPHMSSIRDAEKVIEVLRSYELCAMTTLINRVRGDLILSGDMVDVKTIFEELGLPAAGIIPEDDSISVKSVYGGVLDISSGAEEAFTVLASNIINGKNHIYDYKSFYSGFFGKIRRVIKRKV